MHFLLVVLLIGYSFSFPVEESEQITSSSQSSSTSSTFSSSFMSNVFDFSGLTDRFKSWSRNENNESSQATAESTQISEKSEKNEKMTESYMQSNSQLESEKYSAQSSASAINGDDILITKNEEEITAAESAIAAETSKREKRKMKSAQSQDENICKNRAIESTDFETAKTESVLNSSSKDVELQAVEVSDLGKDNANISESTTVEKSTANKEEKRKKTIQNQTESASQLRNDDVSTLGSVSDTENTSIFESISESVSSLMSSSSSSSSMSQTNSALKSNQGENRVTADEAITMEEKCENDVRKKATFAQAQTDILGTSDTNNIAKVEDTNILDSITQSISSTMGSTSSNSQSQINVMDNSQGDQIAAVESTSTTGMSEGGKKRKSKSSQVQAESTSQATETNTVALAKTESETENTSVTARADCVSLDTDMEVADRSSKRSTIRSTQDSIDQSQSTSMISDNQAELTTTETTDSNNISNAVSENQKKKRKASQIQSESATEIENTAQVTSSQTEKESESFISSMVSNASNAVFGSETSNNSAKSVCESTSSTKSEDESTVVSKSEGVVESITETVTTITSSILSSSSATESSMKDELISSKDTDGAQAISVAKTSI